MKINFNSILYITTTALLLSGCASYQAAPLSAISSEDVHITTSAQNSDIQITAKAFNKKECRKYLDRDVIAKGYQPIQLFIQNNSGKNYSFLLDEIDLPYENSLVVAGTVHTSTMGRILGYGIPGVLLFSPLIIPAIVDGMKSFDANKSLDNDFINKSARNETLSPYSSFNKLIFVPAKKFHKSFNVTLIDQDSNTPETFNVVAS